MSPVSSIGALGFLALALGTLQSVVEPALPLLQRELGVSPAEGALVANALLVTGAVAAPVAGKLGDRYGGKRVLLWLMAVVSAGGLLAAVAPNLPVLLAGQVLQGVMIGALPLSFILVRKHLPAGDSQAAMGVVVALFTGGGIAGTLIAGPLAEGLSWHWMFALPALAVVAGALAVARLLPHDPPAPAEGGIDWPGVLLLSGTLLAFMAGLVTLTGAALPPLAVGAIVLVVAALATGWVAVEGRAAAPMVDLRMLTRPAMWSAAVLTLVVTVTFGMIMFLLPQLFAAEGIGTTAIGLLLLPGAVAGAFADAAGGLAARRFGSRTVVATGLVLTAATTTALAVADTSPWQLAAAKVLLAIAAGIGTTALLAGTASAVPTRDTGIATSLLVVTRVIGIAVGVQVAGAILAAGTDPATGHPADAAFVTAFAVAGAIAALSLLVVHVAGRNARATTPEAPTAQSHGHDAGGRITGSHDVGGRDADGHDTGGRDADGRDAEEGARA